MPGVVASGVAKIVENIGRLPPDVFAETVQTERGEALVDDDGTYLCQQIVNQLQGRAQGVDVAEINDRFHKAGVILDLEDAEDIIKLLSFNFRFAAKKNLTAEQLVSKLDQSSSGWPKCALQTVHNMWSEQGAVIRTHQEAQVTMSVGQLVDVKWKLGMAVSSDSCRSLNSPYVSLLLKVADTSGQIFHKSFEMTVPQFQNFFRQFKEIAAVLETV